MIPELRITNSVAKTNNDFGSDLKHKKLEGWSIVGAKRNGVRICVWPQYLGTRGHTLTRVNRVLRSLAAVGRVKRVRAVHQRDGRPRVDIALARSSVAKGLDLLKADGNKDGAYFCRLHKPYMARLAQRGGAPCPIKPASNEMLGLACWNVAGAKRNKEEIALFAGECRVDILCLQETNLKENETFFMRGFRCAQTAKLGPGARGLALLTRQELNVIDLGVKSDFCQWIRVLGRKQVVLVANVYIPSATSAGKTAALDELYESIARFQKRFPSCTLVLGGDWNMSRDRLSELLAKWDLGLKIVNISGSPDTFHRGMQMRSAIDHWVVSASSSSPRDATVKRNYDISDHWPVVTKLTCPLSSAASEALVPECTMVRERLGSLAAEAVTNHNRFAALLSLMDDSDDDDLPDVMGAQNEAAENSELTAKARLDKLSEDFVKTSWEVAKDLKVVKTHRPVTRASKMRPDCLSVESRAAIRKRRNAWKEVMVAAESNDPATLKIKFQKHKEAMAVCRESIAADRRADWAAFLESGVAQHQNSRLYWRWIKKVCGKSGARKGVIPVRDESGNLLLDPEEISKCWGRHYERLSQDVTGHSKDEAFWADKFSSAPLPELKGLETSPSWKEVNSIIHSLNTAKAPGLSLLGPDWFTLVAEDPTSASESPKTKMGKIVFKLVKQMIDLAYIPKNLCTARVCSIPKKGDTSLMDNYRGISLMEIALKIACSLVNRRVSEALEKTNRICKEQAGFRRGEECIGQVLSLYEICTRREAGRRSTYLAFIDFKKAFDTVPHEAMIAKLSHIGVRGKMLAFVRALYASSSITVASGSRNSSSVPLKRGVRQGCPLSPLLFNVFINDILDSCRAKGAWAPGLDQAVRIPGLLQADDLVLIASRRSKLQAMLDDVSSWSKKWEMATNGAKCGVMGIKDAAKAAKARKWTLLGEEIPVVESYKYLGIMFNDQLSLNDMIKDRVDSVRKVSWEYEKFLRNTSIPVGARLKVLKAVVLPVASFGGELFGMKSTLSNRIQTRVNHALKWLIGVSEKSKASSPSCIMHELDVDSVDSCMSAARARAFFKLKDSKTWISDLIKNPPTKTRGSWVSGTRRWLERNKDKMPRDTLPKTSDASILKRHWVQLVKERVLKTGLMTSLKKSSSMRTYRIAGFSSNAPQLLNKWGLDVSMSRSYTDLLKIRTGFFSSGEKRANAGIIKGDFKEKCPLCGEAVPETLSHYLTACSAWGDARQELVDQLGPMMTGSPWRELSEEAKAVVLLGGVHDGTRLSHFVTVSPDGEEEEELPSVSVSEAVLNFLKATSAQRNSVLSGVSEKSRRPGGMAALSSRS